MLLKLSWVDEDAYDVDEGSATKDEDAADLVEDVTEAGGAAVVGPPGLPGLPEAY